MSRRPRKAIDIVRRTEPEPAKRPPSAVVCIATVIAGFLDGLVAKSLRVWLAEKPGRSMVVVSTASGLDLKFYDGSREVEAPIPFDISKGFFE